MHGGLEAREVQGEARVAAVQLLRPAEKLLLEGLRHAREADPSGLPSVRRRNMGRRRRSACHF